MPLLCKLVPLISNFFLMDNARPADEDSKLVWVYMGIGTAMFLAGSAFYLCFWRRVDSASEMIPVLDSGLRGFVRLIYPYDMKDMFEKGFRKVCWFREIGKLY